METLANLESFVRSAEHQSFSEAARQLGLTPAAVSRNVAMLEKNLGVRLFQRSTRKQTLTEVGARFLLSISGNLDALQSAISDIGAESETPAGILRVSLSPTIGIMHIMPLLPAFLAQFPNVKPEWHFENRQVDLVAENYDAAIGGGFELSPGIISRALAPAHVIAVASPAYLAKQTAPRDPTDLAAHRGIVMRLLRSGRIRRWTMRDADGREMPGSLPESMIVNDPAAMREAALLGLGIALVALVDVLPNLARGDLVRVLPGWYADAGSISLYYASRTLMPARTRAFVDFVADAFKRERLAERFTASLG
jgi:DNA-binding transcriptional LysR family regulator